MSLPPIRHQPGSRSTFRHPFPRNGKYDRVRMRHLVERFWKLNRSAVNPDTDVLAAALRDELGGDMIEATAGEECLTWRIPMHWKVRSGRLMQLDGRVIADYADNPLTLWTHSIAYSGEIDRDTLFAEHLISDPRRPDEMLYHYRNGYKFGAQEWGFSLPWRVVETLTEPRYKVEIDADLDFNGTIKVVDAFLPGELPDTIFIMAHTCHPALVSDGLGCIAVAAELFHELKRRPRRRYSYRFLFGPEYFAAAAYLVKAPRDRVDTLRFGIYLDMLTAYEAIGMQSSMQTNSRMDHIARNVLTSHTNIFIDKPYRKLWGNDETFYNGPGLEIPTIGVARGMFREYHYDTDDLDNYSDYKAEESAWILGRMVEVFETDFVPERRFTGPLYLSRYGLYIDPTVDPKGADNLERMLALIDGQRSCMDLAQKLDVDFFFVRDFCQKLVNLDLAVNKPRPVHKSDAGGF